MPRVSDVRIPSLWAISAVAALMLAAPSTAGPRSARSVPRFQLRLLDGKFVGSADLAGRVTVIDFWGTWCGPCLLEIPEYNEFYRQYKSRGVLLLALALDSGSEEDVRAAVRKLKIAYPVAVPSLKELDLFGDIVGVPTTLVVDQKGEVVREFIGASASKQRILRELVESLLASR